MVNSEIQERAISLGKDLVRELNLERGVDTLSRWMAHYIAEQIAIAEKAIGAEKAEAKQRCFDTILKLWEHRASLPNNLYPFKSFEPIFQVLDRLNPENPRSYYFNNSYFQEIENSDASDERANEVRSWLDVALSIDIIARVLIDLAIAQAAHNALDEKTATWLEKARGISDRKDNDFTAIIRLIEDSQEDDSDEEDRERTCQQLRSIMEKLDTFMEWGSLLRDDLTENLKDISNKNSELDA